MKVRKIALVEVVDQGNHVCIVRHCWHRANAWLKVEGPYKPSLMIGEKFLLVFEDDLDYSNMVSLDSGYITKTVFPEHIKEFATWLFEHRR